MGYFKNFFCNTGRLGVPMLERVDDVAIRPVGERMTFTDGGASVVAVYLKAGTSGISAGTACTLEGGEAKPVANESQQSKAVGIAAVALDANKYGWFIVSGVAPVLFSATVTLGGKAYIAAPGLLSGSATAGKQVGNCTAVEAAGMVTSNKLVKCSVENPYLQTGAVA